MAQITKQLALQIVKKLEATVQERLKKPHDLAMVYHEGKLIAHFGIRRGSRKDQGHDYVPSQLHLSPHQARLLAQCPLSKEDWLGILADKDLI